MYLLFRVSGKRQSDKRKEHLVSKKKKIPKSRYARQNLKEIGVGEVVVAGIRTEKERPRRIGAAPPH